MCVCVCVWSRGLLSEMTCRARCSSTCITISARPFVCSFRFLGERDKKNARSGVVAGLQSALMEHTQRDGQTDRQTDMERDRWSYGRRDGRLV